jgi:hypothetical protein
MCEGKWKKAEKIQLNHVILILTIIRRSKHKGVSYR